jgi:nucleotide-binding universal stress UspA family protein
MYSRILVANDGSPGGQKALSGAIELAQKLSAELHMVTVEELPRFPASIDEIAEEKDEANRRFAPVINAAKAEAKGAGAVIETHLVPATSPKGSSG